jgi:hypothetical protein
MRTLPKSRVWVGEWWEEGELGLSWLWLRLSLFGRAGVRGGEAPEGPSLLFLVLGLMEGAWASSPVSILVAAMWAIDVGLSELVESEEVRSIESTVGVAFVALSLTRGASWRRRPHCWQAMAWAGLVVVQVLARQGQAEMEVAVVEEV